MIMIHECEDGRQVTVEWSDMLLLPAGKYVTFSVTIFESGVIYFEPPTEYARFGAMGIEGDGGKVLMQQAPEVLTIGPWVRMTRFTEVVGPRGAARIELAMLPHMLLDHEKDATLSQHSMKVDVDILLEDMRIVQTVNTTLSLVNPRVPPTAGPPTTCSGGAAWAAPTCAADQSNVPATAQVVTLDCTFVAGMCPGLCGGDCPKCPCFNIWTDRKCRIKGTDRLCKRNKNVKANCKKTCSQVLNTTCDVLS
jgi:hypothetical protein